MSPTQNAFKLSELVENFFDPMIRHRGHEYVLKKRIGPPRLIDGHAIFRVRGSETYDVEVSDPADDGTIEVFCDCPHFEDANYCKHLWAAILVLDDIPTYLSSVQKLIQNKIEPTLIHVYELELYGTPEELRGKFLPPIASPQPSWQSLVNKIANPNQSNSRFAPSLPTQNPKRLIIYELDLTLSRQTGQLMLRIWQQTQNQKGGWGKLKDLSLSIQNIHELDESLDREILCLLIASNSLKTHYSWTSQHYVPLVKFKNCEIPPALSNEILKKLSLTKRLFLRSSPSSELALTNPLSFDESEFWEIQINIKEVENIYSIQGCFKNATTGESIPTKTPLICLKHGPVVFDNRIATLKNSNFNFEWIAYFRQSDSIKVPLSDAPSLIETFSQISQVKVEWPQNLEIQSSLGVPRPVLRIQSHSSLENNHNFILCELLFDYDNNKQALWHDKKDRFVDFANKSILLRDFAKEIEFYNLIIASHNFIPFIHDNSLGLLNSKFLEVAKWLISMGWSVLVENKKISTNDKYDFEVSSGIDWFELKGNFQYSQGSVATLGQLLEAFKNKSKYISLDDGSLGLLPEDWFLKYETLLNEALVDKNNPQILRFNKIRGMILSAWLENEERLSTDRSFQAFRKQLEGATHPTKLIEAHTSFAGELRPYQKQGLGWLQNLQKLSLGGVLADDMGLGKTIQVIAMLCGAYAKNKTLKPTLIVAPKSLLFNWASEIAKFAPHLDFVIWSSSNRSQNLKDFMSQKFVIVTYDTLRMNIERFKSAEFFYVIVDEAQAIKNAASLSHKACSLLRSQNRLVLTGTPIENSLSDLAALVDFANPGLLGPGIKKYMAKRNPSSEESHFNLKSLSRALSPIILRRTKAEVLNDLPEKTEKIVFCELNPKQRKIYQELQMHYQKRIKKEISSRGLARSKLVVLEALLRLRQVACHPNLVEKKSKDFTESAKIDLLLENLEVLLPKGHKVLIFSQFTSLLDLVKQSLGQLHIAFEYLDGKTSQNKRQEIVNDFQNSESRQVFLISLKAGGVGLNLTAADYVFILDPWWNPAVESQAIDRAHRIGQKNKVIAYRFIAKDTIEEKILLLQGQKKDLAKSILDGDSTLMKKLSQEDIEMLLS